MNWIVRLGIAILVAPMLATAGTAQGTGSGGAIPASPAATSGVVTSDIVLSDSGVVAAGNAVTVTLLGLQHDFSGDLQITLSYISSNGTTLQSVDLINRVGATTANPYGSAADFGNNQGVGDNYQFNTDYTGNIWNVAACADAPACTEPYGDADSLPGVSTDKINNGQYFTSTTGGTKTNLSYAFAGMSVSGGTWRLTITDAADPNAGSYIGWQISIATTTAASSPTTLMAVAGTPQSTNISTSFASALQAKVTDASSNPVSGVTVTFTAPSSGTSATFSGSASATVVTNSSGIALSPIPVANATAGVYTVSASASGLTPASFSLTNSSASTATTFTTYLGTYGSGAQTYNGASTVLPLRAYIPGGATQMQYFWANLNATSGGATEFQTIVTCDGAGNCTLRLFDGTNNAPAWPFLSLNSSGSTVTLATPITLGSMQISAYRFALSGNEFQLDLTAARSGTFNDQIIVLASYGQNYSSPWYGVDGQWSASSSSGPTATLSSTSFNYGSQPVGTTVTKTLTVTNNGGSALTVSSLQLSGTNSADFTATGCSTSVAAGGNCTISVAFDPFALGSRSATLSINDNATGSPQTVNLSGIGSNAATPTTFTTYLGTYGSGSQTFTGASVVLPLRAYAPTGATQIQYVWANLTAASGGATEFQTIVACDGAGNCVLRLFDGTNTAPAWPYLALNGSGNTITLATPIILGSLQITAYRFALAGNEFQLDLSVTRPGTFNDQIIILASYGQNYSSPWYCVDGQWSGSSTSAPAVMLSSTNFNFGSQQVATSMTQALTVTNSGTAALSVSSLQITGANAADFTATGCTSPVTAGTSCTITLTFNPSALGLRSATLSLAENAAGSPQTVNLSGTGSDSATPTTFTTYLGTYGSGSQTYNGSSAVLPLRAYIPGGATQTQYFWAVFNSTSNGATEFQTIATCDGAGNCVLRLFDGTNNAPAWPYLTLNSSGSIITLATPITLGTVQITAYRFALAGNEFQLDLSINGAGSFNDQVIVLASYGQNYSSPWYGVDGIWSNP